MFAVTLMLFCAMVPLVGNDSNGATTTSNSSDDEKTFSLSELLELIDDLKQDDAVVNSSLVPVTAPDKDWTPIDIDANVDAKKEINDGQYDVLDKDYVFSNNGSIEVQDGGKIVLFPLDNNGKFSLKNNNSSNWDVIKLHRGAYVEIMGITFVTVCSEKGNTNTTLFKIETWKTTTDPTAKFEYTYANDNFTLDLKVSDGTKLWMHEFVIWGTDSVSKDLVIKGQVTNDGGKVTFTNCSLLMDKVKHGNRNYTVDLTINKLAIQCLSTPKNDITSVETHLKADVDVTINKIDWKMGSADEKLISIVVNKSTTKPSTLKTLNTLEMVEKTSYSNDTLNREYTITGANGVELYLNNLNFTLTESNVLRSVFNATGMVLTLKNIDAKITEVVKSDSKTITADANEDLKITSETFKNTFKIWRYSIPLQNFEKLDIELNGADVKYTDGKNLSVKSQNLAIAFDCPSTPEFNFNAYTPHVVVGIEGFDFAMVKGDIIIKGNPTLTVGIDEAGTERLLTLTADVNSISRISGIWYIDIKSAHLENDIPMMSLTKKIHTNVGLLDNFYVTCDATGLKYNTDDHIFTANTLSLNYRNFSILEDFGIDFSEGVTIKQTKDTFTVKGSVLNGYTKEIASDKESFTHTDCDIQLYFVSKDPFMIGVIIDGGDANLGKCTFPFEFKITKNVDKITCNDTSAFRFFFEKGVNGIGTVKIDTTKAVDAEKRIASFNDGEQVYSIMPVVDDKMTGLIMSFDVPEGKTGRLIAQDNYVLPDNLAIRGLSIEKIDDRTARFTVLGTVKNITVDTVCKGNGPYTLEFQYNGKVLDQGTFLYGDEVELLDEPEEIPDHRFVGWTDGSGNIYNIANSYYMPARDVVLTPVYSQILDKKDVQSVSRDIVIDARGEDVLELTIDAVDYIGGYATTVTIVTDSATISMDGSTFKRTAKANETALWVNVMKIDKSNNDLIQKRIEGTTAFDINMKYIDKDYNVVDGFYNGASEFLVTLNVNVDNEKILKDFKVKYVDEFGHEEDVPIIGYIQCEDGTFNITFKVNHFSTYAVQPVYEEVPVPGNDNLNIFLIIVLIVIVVAAILVAGYILSAKSARKH